MASINIVNLPRITPPQLRFFLLSPAVAPSLSVVDVRDSDYIGGHIRGSSHVPTSTHDTALSELARKLKDKKLVVFHCMLSQQRGPGSALRYARERERLLRQVEGEGDVAIGVDVLHGKQDLEGVEEGKQIVAVLERGFEGWVLNGYGEDERITEGFVKDIWDGFD